MKEIEVVIKNKLGLHARAAAKLVSLAGHFDSEVFLEKDGQRVNGQSIMGVMMLAAAKGSTIKIIADGDDEEVVLDALQDLINGRFGETP
jgi:phosphocarrier protein